MVNSNSDNDNDNSRSNSLKSECGGVKRVSSIPYGSALRSPSGPAQQIHTSHKGQHMVVAQRMESQVAQYLIVSLPPPKDGLLSSFFPLFLFCLKLHIKRFSFVHLLYFHLPVVLTLHTSVSILLLICCICKTHANLEKRFQVSFISKNNESV